MSKLSTGSLKKYFYLGGKSESEVSDTLQVLQSKETEGKVHGDIYTATLSDSTLKFEKFFLPKKLGGPIKVGDLVVIKSINKCVAKGKVFFKVLKYEVIGYSNEIIGEPVQVDKELLDKAEQTYIQSLENSNSKDKTNIESNTTTNKEVKSKEEEKQIINKVHPTQTHHMLLNTLSTFTKDLSVLVRCVKKSEKKNFQNS